MIIKMDLQKYVRTYECSPPVRILNNFSSLINTITNPLELRGNERHIPAKRYILSL
ncbi:MAG: hypothetical protein ACYDEE_01730 [Ignavibacteriaceae bacterium]